jgi:hypothetical protein
MFPFNKKAHKTTIKFCKLFIVIRALFYLPKLLAKAALIKRTNKGCGFKTVLLYSG